MLVEPQRVDGYGRAVGVTEPGAAVQNIRALVQPCFDAVLDTLLKAGGIRNRCQRHENRQSSCKHRFVLIG